MFRELSQIMLAIQLAAGYVSPVRAEQLARTIQHQSDVVGIDPLIDVAIITHESRWNERAISQDGEDYGLMQVRARYYGGLKEALLNGTTNIKAGSYIIKVDIDLCRHYLHREPSTQEWMSCYQGSCINKQHMCKPTALTKQVEDYSLCLEETVNRDAEGDKAFDCDKIYEQQ